MQDQMSEGHTKPATNGTPVIRRIAHIEVTGLFGMFNHSVPLNLGERVTIIQGPNGFGKTVMLRMLAALFAKRFQFLRTTPYDTFSVVFDDGTTLTLRRVTNEPTSDRRHPAMDLLVTFGGTGFDYHELLLPDSALRRPQVSAAVIDHELPELERIGARLWQHLETGEVLRIEEVIDRYPVLGTASSSLEADQGTEWLTALASSIPVHVVEAQRLLVYPARSDPAYERRAGPQQAVNVYASELARLIQAKLADYANLSQSLDRTFPFRVVRTDPSAYHDAEALRNALAELEARRRELRDAGLLDTEGDVDFPTVTEVDDEKRALLEVYVTDSRDKLAIFDELAGKTELIKKILNSRFLHKDVQINREDGLRVVTQDGRSLPLTALSSGEQHELVLLYELLFRVPEGSLILLDEPELSLHVEWQAAFLADLLDIANLRYLDVIIATHSPQIIGDRWDLTVELSSPAA